VSPTKDFNKVFDKSNGSVSDNEDDGGLKQYTAPLLPNSEDSPEKRP
jgi:hypothetical protein